MNGQRVDQKTLDHTPANLKDAQIAAILAINQMTLSSADGLCSNCDQPDVQQSNGQGQARQPNEVTQHRAFQVEAMSFQIAEHFFDPHSQAIGLQSQTPIGQVGRQAPGLIFADLPMNQQVDWVDLLFGQVAFTQPYTLSRLGDVAAEIFPFGLLIQANMDALLLAQLV